MEVMSIILEILIVLEVGAVIGGVIYFEKKRRKAQSKNVNLYATAKMMKNILLNNKWENIDNMIKILRNDSVHINYKLR